MPTELGPHDLTSNTSHSPFVASDSASGTNAFKAFDTAAGADYWNLFTTTGWLQIDIGTAAMLGSYSLFYRGSGYYPANDMPASWTMQGSNNGSTWTTVDTRSGQTAWNTAGETRSYTPTTITTAYRYFRINLTGTNGGAAVAISELSLFAVALTAQTITFATIPAHLTTDGPITLAATASSGLTVTYGITGPATLAGSVVTLTGSTGTVVVTASQAGNGTYSAAPNVVRSFAVTAAVITSRGGITYDQIVGTDRSGTGAKFAMVTGTLTTGHVPAFDATGTLVDSGGTGGGGITALTGDVTASGTGSVAATVVKVNGVSFAALGTGILKNTTGTGVPSIAIAADFPTLNQNTTGSAASFTGSLAGDVTGTQAATVVGKVNGVSFASLPTGLVAVTTTTGVPRTATAADVTLALGSGGNTARGSFFIGGSGGSNTGTNNYVFGSSGLLVNTTGSGNNAVGYASLASNLTGNYNMAIGYGSLNQNTSGTANVAIGYGAGSLNFAVITSNVTGTFNTFIGYSASIASGVDPLTNASAIGANAIVPVSNCVALGDSGVTRIYLGGKVSIYIGAGSPNSAVVGKPGDIYLNTSGGATTTLYVKESGTNTNTGWVAK